MMSIQAEIKCKVIEDILYALTIATLPKIWPCTNTSTQNTGILGSIWNKVQYQYTQFLQRIK